MRGTEGECPVATHSHTCPSKEHLLNIMDTNGAKNSKTELNCQD